MLECFEYMHIYTRIHMLKCTYLLKNTLEYAINAHVTHIRVRAHHHFHLNYINIVLLYLL